MPNFAMSQDKVLMSSLIDDLHAEINRLGAECSFSESSPEMIVNFMREAKERLPLIVACVDRISTLARKQAADGRRERERSGR